MVSLWIHVIICSIIEFLGIKITWRGLESAYCCKGCMKSNCIKLLVCFLISASWIVLGKESQDWGKDVDGPDRKELS